jgi:hypothetical protein
MSCRLGNPGQAIRQRLGLRNFIQPALGFASFRQKVEEAKGRCQSRRRQSIRMLEQELPDYSGIKNSIVVHWPEKKHSVPDAGTALECADLSALLAGDWSPSNAGHITNFPRATPRGAASPTSRRSRQSGDKSPHSKILVAREDLSSP